MMRIPIILVLIFSLVSCAGNKQVIIREQTPEVIVKQEPAVESDAEIDNEGVLIKNTLSALIDAYESKSLKTFTGFIDESLENYKNFLDKIKNFFIINKDLNLDLVVIAISKLEGKIRLNISWEKSFTDQYSLKRQSQGESLLVLRQNQDGILKIISIEQANPFF